MMYRTFKRSATDWQSFSGARKITVETHLSYEEARAYCDEFNTRRTPRQVRRGTKLEFEAM